MKIATWNVNSLRVRLPHVLEWLKAHDPEVLGLQETKLPDPEFPVDAFNALGYEVAYAGQPAYNGVAVISKTKPQNVVTDLPGMEDPARRVLGVTIDTLRVLNLYVPNGQSVDSDKYQYKLRWLERLESYALDQLQHFENLVLMGDFNIAPEDRDVHDPELWRGKILFSDPEKKAFRSLLDLGLDDAFRRFEQADKAFSWWDYRAGAFRRNRGLRIDHILCSRPLTDGLIRCDIDKTPRSLERPSDHTPVVAEFALEAQVL